MKLSMREEWTAKKETSTAILVCSIFMTHSVRFQENALEL